MKDINCIFIAVLKMKDFTVKHSIISIASSSVYLNERRVEHRMSARRNKGKLSGSNLPYFSFKLPLLSHLTCVFINACYLLLASYSICLCFHMQGRKSIASQHFFPYTPFLTHPSLFYILILFIITSVVGHEPRNCQEASC